jgi:RHS repeat-associated protein
MRAIRSAGVGAAAIGCLLLVAARTRAEAAATEVARTRVEVAARDNARIRAEVAATEPAAISARAVTTIAARLTDAARGVPLLIPLQPWSRGRTERGDQLASATTALVTRTAIEASDADEASELDRSRASLRTGTPGPDSPSSDERALARALARYAHAAASGRPYALDPLLNFTRTHLESAFVPALLVDLGTLYRETAQPTRALELWQRAWWMTRQADDDLGRAIAETALGELVRLRAQLGHEVELAALLNETVERPLHGTPAQRVSEAARALASMQTDPARTFRCGPLALAELLAASGTAAPEQLRQLRAAKANPRGTSLAQLSTLAARAGMSYQPVFRPPHSAPLAPALIHLRLGHWAAVLEARPGALVLADAAYGGRLPLSAASLDAEASGYELIPSGPLPTGYRVVGPREAARVWGRGTTSSAPDDAATGPADAEGGDDVAAACLGCTHWSYEPLVVGLALHSRPLGYAPALGPAIQIDAFYSQRDTQQPRVFDYGNLGSRWTLNWLSFVSDHFAADGGATLYRRGGGGEPFGFAKQANTSALGPYSASLLSREVDQDQATTGFIREFPDGSRERFEHALGSKFLLSAVIDPQGNSVSLTYDGQHRLMTLTDALGQETQFSYDVHGDPLKITQITDPFGRTASFAYDVVGDLASITAASGEQATFSYGAADFIQMLETPYGTTHFDYGDATTDAALGGRRFLQITDAIGRVTRVESRADAPGLTDSDPDLSVPSGMRTHDDDLQLRNTFIWNPAQFAQASMSADLDYSAARVIHWLARPDGGSARVIESIKPPLEARIWFDYPGQDDPSQLGSSSQPLHRGRVLDDNSTQLFSYGYNARGNVETFTDPVGRSRKYAYADNGIDPITVSNVTGAANEQLSSFGWNDQHRPISFAAASGRSLAFEYDDQGRLTKRSDADGNDTTYRYDDRANLVSITGPNAAAESFGYDASGRLTVHTDRAGIRIEYGYDAQDRPIQQRYRDGTNVTFRYEHADLVEVIDRLGRSTGYRFDAARQQTALDAWPNQTTLFEYGPDGSLARLTDADAHATTYTRDLQGRPLRVEYADGSARSYAWEQCSSRLHSLLDAKQQTTRYAYTADDRLARIAYPDASVATPSVQFGYDSAYPRLTSMRDGLGETTYAYYPVSPAAAGAGLLQSITAPSAGPGGNDLIEYTYDPLERVSERKVDGESEQVSYDALGRPTAIDNPLGAFKLQYDGATTHLIGLDSDASPKLVASYASADAGARLAAIRVDGHQGEPLVRFAYRYDALGRITAAAESFGQAELPDLNPAPKALSPPAADSGGRNDPPAADSGGRNDPPAADNGGLNGPPGLLLFGLAALGCGWIARRRRELRALLPLMAASFCSQPDASEGGGSAQITRYAYDRAGRLYTASLQPTAAGPAGVAYRYQYDALANPTSLRADGPTVTQDYSAANATIGGHSDVDGYPLARAGETLIWDAAGRVTQISAGDATSEFTYDGLSRLVRIVEKQAGKIRSDRAYFHCGPSACLEHDNLDQGSLSKRYYAEGMRAVGRNLYYVSDPLGSVRLLVDDRGSLRAHYAYDPYGNPSKLAGDLDSDFQYAGYFRHAPSGLHFARYRALDSSAARWLSRDQLAAVDGGGPDYVYAGSDPLNRLDIDGLATDVTPFAELTAGLAPRTDEPPSVPGVVRRRASTQFAVGATGLAAPGSASAALSTSSEWMAGSTSGQTLAMCPVPSTRNETLAAMPMRLGTP